MKIKLNEHQYKLLFEFEYEDLSGYESQLKDLIESGQLENVKMAFQIGRSISEDSYQPQWFKKFILDEYGELLLKFTGQSPTETTIERLEILFSRGIFGLSNNKISKLPKNFDKLKNLQTLNLSSNDFVEFPMALCHLSNLKHVLLNDNQISNVPSCIAKLKQLEFLDLRNNNIPKDDYEKISQLHPEAIISLEDNIYAQYNKLHEY